MNAREMAHQARYAARQMMALDSEIKASALNNIAAALLEHEAAIVQANQLDLDRSMQEGLATPLLKRLKFDVAKIKDVVAGINSLNDLPEPVGQTLLSTELEPGLELYRVSCPIGVIGVIFESRPDALVQISTLCLKTGNAILLKGGSEAIATNRILADIIANAGIAAGMPEGWLHLLETRADVNSLLELDDDVDLLIPRGSNEFVRYIMDHTRIPVLGHADGVCHLYLAEDAEEQMAISLAVDSKTQYVAVCNAAETILIDAKAVDRLLLPLVDALKARGVEIFGDEKVCQKIGCQMVTDWHTEYLDYKVSLKIVDDLDAAVEHINRYGSGHTESIVTPDANQARRFMLMADAGNVFWNASTRFSDGFRYGFGAEVGVSTGKIHARGPVGVEGLLTYKYKLFGHGQRVADFSSGEKAYTHRSINRQSPF
ncbi:MAG: glutamate-5-semialdehyde dehydrogenase [Eubacteriales bacterium]|nr:glutamate-5-semialdehyde dehydrogenase [Eubacteriales bacterium]